MTLDRQCNQTVEEFERALSAAAAGGIGQWQRSLSAVLGALAILASMFLTLAMFFVPTYALIAGMMMCLTSESMILPNAASRRDTVRRQRNLCGLPFASGITTSSVYTVSSGVTEATVVKNRAKAGVAIVVEPFTGEVLALANYPSFDPNKFSKESPQQRRNRAIADSFEPGSIFKTILAAAALEEGVVGVLDKPLNIDHLLTEV